MVEKKHLESSDGSVHSSELRFFFLDAAELLCKPLSACINHRHQGHKGQLLISQCLSGKLTQFLTLEILRCSLGICMRETGGETDEN